MYQIFLVISSYLTCMSAHMEHISVENSNKLVLQYYSWCYSVFSKFSVCYNSSIYYVKSPLLKRIVPYGHIFYKKFSQIRARKCRPLSRILGLVYYAMSKFSYQQSLTQLIVFMAENKSSTSVIIIRSSASELSTITFFSRTAIG